MNPIPKSLGLRSLAARGAKCQDRLPALMEINAALGFRAVY